MLTCVQTQNLIEVVDPFKYVNYNLKVKKITCISVYLTWNI